MEDRPMIRSARLGVSSLALLVALAAASSANGTGSERPLPDETARAAARSARGVPVLQVTSPGGATSLLVGTLHQAADGLRQPAASIFENARAYVVEGLPAKSVGRPEVAPEVRDGKAVFAPWTHTFSEAQFVEATRRASCIPQLAQLPPLAVKSFVAESLTYRSAQHFSGWAVYRCASAGLRSTDALLAAAAADRGLKPSALETPEFTQGQRNNVPESINIAIAQDAFLPAGDAALQRVIAALNLGDYEAVGEALRMLHRTPAAAQPYERIMVTERNVAWMPELRRQLDAGGAVVVVGAYHLPGPMGLIALLRAAGYQVAPTEVPATN